MTDLKDLNGIVIKTIKESTDINSYDSLKITTSKKSCFHSYSKNSRRPFSLWMGNKYFEVIKNVNNRKQYARRKGRTFTPRTDA